MPLPAALRSTRSIRNPPPNEQSTTTTAKVPPKESGEAAVRERDEGSIIDRINPERETDRGESASQAINAGEDD
jgi:hypothetical protein